MYKSLSFLCSKTGLPNELDLNEPERVAESVELMNLKHVVITAVARDDLRDGDLMQKRFVKYVNVIHIRQLKFYRQIWVGIMKHLKH